MLWADVSEIICGLVISKKLAIGGIRQELLIPPYNDIIKLMKAGTTATEDLIEQVGLSPVQASLEAVKSMNGLGDKNWIKILEDTAMNYDAGAKLEKFGKRLQQGDNVDWAAIKTISHNALQGTGGDFIPLSEIEPGEIAFKETGFMAIDKHLGGLPIVGQVIVAAQTSTGKTSFMVGLASCWAKKHPKDNVAIFTLEMMKEEIARRFDEIYQLSNETKSRIQINDAIVTPEEVIAKASTIENLGLVCIDFADLLIKGDTTESAMAHIYRTFMLGAKQLGCPVVLLSQLNRGYSGGIPRPSDIRYCLPASAKIPNSFTGEQFSPKDKSDGYIWAFDGESFVPNQFTCRPTGNKQQILKITTNSGFVLRCSDNHPLLRGKDWVESKNLVVGDTVAVVRKLSPGCPIPYSPKKARLLGYMIGDGYMPSRSKGGINWVEPDDVVVKDFKECLKLEFSELITRDVWHRNAWQVNIIHNTNNMKPTRFALWLEQLGIRGIKSKQRFIPTQCFTWSDDAIASLLQGLFTSDGSIANGNISFASYAPQLLLDAKHLLLRFGIIARISGTKLTISNKVEAEKFYKYVGFVGHKQIKLENYMNEHYNLFMNHGERLPMEVTKILTKNGFMSMIRNRRVTRYRLDRMLSAVDDLKYYSSDYVWWDDIKSIEEDGIEDTYDLTVPQHHNFVVDGFVTHNTGLAEALGWMILMLYNPATDWFAEEQEDNGVLTIREGYAYIVCWKVRGGFRFHKDDSPGAIQINFNGKRGWRTDSEGKWFDLRKA